MKNLSWIDLLPPVLKGAEGEVEVEEETGEVDPDAGDGDKDQEQEKEAPKDNSGLLSALQAERARAKAAEREAKALKREKEQRELAEKGELEQVQTKLQETELKTQKLAAGLLKRSLNDAIKAAAQEQNFIDTTDAIDGVDRSLLVFEQDDDDPSAIEIDTKSIQAAVKKLATAKPHFIKGGTSDNEPSGSGFGGTSQKKKDDDTNFRTKYPSLQ